MCYSFLWKGKREVEGIQLVKWNKTAKPEEYGGWVLKNIFVFSRALAAKSLCMLLFNNGLWGKVMKIKYLDSRDLEDWIQHERKSFKRVSNIWKGLVKYFNILGNWVSWNIK